MKETGGILILFSRTRNYTSTILSGNSLVLTLMNQEKNAPHLENPSSIAAIFFQGYPSKFVRGTPLKLNCYRRSETWV